MQKVRLEVSQITPGMRLAEPITNTAGITLIPAGIRLTPMFLARIKKWNIPFLDVFAEDQPPDSDPPQNPASQGTATASQPGFWKRGEAKTARTGDQEPTLTEEQELFARSLATEVSRAFANLQDNPLMMRLRAITIKQLFLAGADAPINVLRRGPQNTIPLPEESS